MGRIVMLLSALCICWLGAVMAEAQPCRRTCQDGESRDARGCCIPRKLPEPAGKEARDTTKGKLKPNKPRATSEPRRKKSTTASGVQSGPVQSAPASQNNDETPAKSVRVDVQKVPISTGVMREDTSESSRVERQNAPPLLGGIDSATDNGPRMWPKWVTIGSGTTMILAGGFLHWRALKLRRQFVTDFEHLCGQGCVSIPAQLGDTLSSSQLQQKLGIAAYAVGGMVATAGLVWWYLDRTAIPADAGNTISMTPWIDAQLLGVTAGRRF